ncbi:hypothetical protein FF38_11264 [Lucilia cuprina]|uniref:Nudix hydrolase domain-containing protein n=1 Tax=Lucilia cuprina TaxID=7375 RepID=A0A0L0BL61_LUCCU|nr:Nucleoside diphosphate-linked moiety X motif 8 [Lucilia cuprina]KNC20845.1 hypothetical protein FF38_11264 [Lucilia cuprina]
MASLLGRCRTTLVAPLLRTQIFKGTYLNYSSSRISDNLKTDYEINENLLLSEENRQRCLEKMGKAPPVGIKLRGAKSETKFAAVLIALCTDEETQTVSLLYTRRSHLLSRHMRQISFPGGIKEDNEDFVQCALRETEEEIGILPSRVEIWGTGNLITPPHTAAIMPVVGVIRNFRESELKLNYDEVEEAFAIPIKILASPQTLRYTQFKTGYSSAAFVVDDKRIWGVTGFITNIFLNCFLPPEFNKLKNCVKFIRPFRSKSKATS